MSRLAEGILTVIMAMPVAIVLHMFLPESMEWWQSVSVGTVSAMVSGHWLRHRDQAERSLQPRSGGR